MSSIRPPKGVPFPGHLKNYRQSNPFPWLFMLIAPLFGNCFHTVCDLQYMDWTGENILSLKTMNHL